MAVVNALCRRESALPDKPLLQAGDELRLRLATLHVRVDRLGDVEVFDRDHGGELVIKISAERIARGPHHIGEAVVELLRRLNFSVTFEARR
jgi:hypothetical protein